MENNQKMKEMEEELSFYKRLVSTLPFSFTYSDPEIR
jgi:hypothetical protein